MANRNLRYVIEADSTQAVAETKKVNTEIEKTGPTAERNTRQAAAGFGSMTAQIMAASGGLKQFQSQHDAFTAALIRDARATADVFGSVGDAVGGFAHFLEQSGKAAVAGVLAFKSYATVVGGYSTAIASAGSGTSSFVDAYRVLRIALSPTPFSVVSVAAGILTEEIIGTTLETGKLIEVRANLAARTGIDVQTLTTLADASKLAGKSSEYYLDTLTKLKAQQQSGTAAAGLTTLGLSADAKATPLLLGQIGEAFDRLRDPQQRAQVAFQLFGSEFEKVLPQLNERLRESTVEALAFSRVLTNEEATSIDLVKRRIDSLKDTFGGFFGYFRIEVQNFKTELSLATAEVLNFTTELLRLQVLPEAGASSKSGISAADAKRLADDARGFGRTRLAGSGSSALSDINAPGLNAIQDRLDNSKEGISAALSEQQNIRKTSLAALAVPGVSVIDKDVLARKAFAADSEAAQLQERLKGLEDADNARKTVEAEAKALRTAIASRQKSIRDDLATAQASLLDPFARSIAEFDKHGVDLVNVKSGDKIVQRPLGDDEVSARNQTLQAIVTGHQKEQLKQAAEAAQSLYQLQLGYESGLFQKRTELRIQDDQRQIDAATKLQEYRLEELGVDRDQRLRALDETGAQSVRQKIDLERSKSAIEIEYLNKTLDVRRQLFDDATNREAIELRRIYESTGLDPKETARRLAAFETAKDQERENLGTSNKAAIDTVRANAQQRSEDIQRDAALRQFESFKQSANGILDSLFSRTRTLGQLVGDFFKTAVLTPLKEIASSQIAKALFEGLNPGQHVTFDASKGSGKFSGISSVLNGFGLGGASVRGVPGIGGTSVNQTVTPFDGSQASGYGTGGAVSIFGGAQNIATRLLTGQSALFLDGQEAIGAGENTGGYPTLPSGLIDRTGGYSSSLDPTGLIGGPGGTSGFSGSVSLGGGTATPSSGGGILSRLGGLFGGRQQTSGGSVAIAGESTGALSNLAGLFGFGGGAGGTYGSGVIGTGLTGGLKAFAGSTGGALVGAGLAYDGLKRGGIAGTAETTAGGALLGYKFGGGFGAVIGAGIGLGAGIIRSLFFSSDADQVKKQVKDLYQLSISTNIANQIVQTAKQSYGGSFSVAIRSKPVLDLLSLYAQSTGQNFFFQNTPKPAYLTESGGDIFQQATYVNGKAYSFAGGLPVANGIPTSTIPSYVVGQQTSRVNGVDYTTPTFGGSGGMSIQLDGPATTALLQGQIVSNPRLVASANAQAQNGNFDRRQQAARVLSPSLIFG